MTERSGGILRLVAFIVLVLALIGFGSWAGTVSGYDTPDSSQQADAIVILTGDEGRLSAGGQILQQGQAPRILISGVHPSVASGDLRPYTGLTTGQYDCCVELGREAADTVGNARETAEWVRTNGFTSLIIVTSDYHLPRSLIEMKAAMPHIDLIPYPVRTSPPWQDPAAARLWLQEYAKFATVWLGTRFAGDGDTPS